MRVNKAQATKLLTYLEENLRASRRAGLRFVDPRNYRESVLSRQNHVIFGRRGAGKSTLLASLERLDFHWDENRWIVGPSMCARDWQLLGLRPFLDARQKTVPENA